MRVGYSYWGFLGDHKLDADGNELSTPDGNATYSWALIHEMQERGHTVYSMQIERDLSGISKYGEDLFAAFSRRKRFNAFNAVLPTHGEQFPELDVLLVEWRFPIPGRNCPPLEAGERGTGGYSQPDLDRQRDLLRHYSTTKTKIVIWDLDHKLTLGEEVYWEPAAILETSVNPRQQYMPRRRVEPPFIINDLLQFPTVQADPRKKLAYVGSRYERDDVITKYISPPSDAYPGQVHFYGNWLNSLKECERLWPNVAYNGRITTKDFRSAYADAVACPLLAKESYIKTGFITPRPWEAVLFGTIPVGIRSMAGIEQYAINNVEDGDEMTDLLYEMSQMTLSERDLLRQESAHMLRHMDARHFVDVIEDVANESDYVVPEEHNG